MHAFPSKYINTHFASDYIVKFANLGNSRAINEREWGEIDTCLKSGGAVVINVPGHFMAIVGIRQDDDTGYPQYLLWDSAKNKNRKTNNDGRAWLTKGDFAGEKLTIRDYTTITPR